MIKTVLVTGASGFIGKCVTKEFLDSGYKVRGSVRSDHKALETRLAVGVTDEELLSFVELDLNSDEGWSEALKGVDGLIHTASPFPMGSPKDPDDLIKPAVDGTLRALTAATEAGVKRVVLTSSVVAVYNDELRADQAMLDESNWSPTRVSSTSAYDDSKTLAEKAAWEYVEKTDSEMQLSTVNPGVVFGTPLDENYGTSLDLVARLLSGQDPMLPDLALPAVDVADVASMHRLAFENDVAIGKRFLASGGSLTMVEAAKILNEHVDGSKAKARQAPNFMIKAASKVMPEMKSISSRLGKSAAVSNEQAQSILGVDFVSPKDALLASARFIRQ